MAFLDKIKKFIENSREKHKLSFIDDSTYREKWSLRLSSFNLYSLIALYTIVVFLILFFLIKYTSVKNLFIDAPPTASVTQINENSEVIDSLTTQLESRQKYMDDLLKILKGESFSDSVDAMNDTVLSNYEANFNKSKEDSLLRHKVENVDQQPNEIMYDFFFAPVKGVVSQSFAPDKGHFGVDIVTEEDTPVKSCLEGTIIFSGWTTNDGEVIVIQHSKDFISVYKHCQSSLKQVGDQVQTADPIAVVGNSGKHTSGPHLHFEIWKEGRILNPLDFINFKK